MNKAEFHDLVGKISNGKATEAEIALYNRYYASFQQAGEAWDEEEMGEKKLIYAKLKKRINQQIKPRNIIPFWKKAVLSDSAWNKIPQHTGNSDAKERKLFSFHRYIAVAAAMTIFSLISFFIYKSIYRSDSHTMNIAHDVLPGTHQATLRAASGKIYNLQGSKQEIIAGEDVIRYKDGVLIETEDHIDYFTLATPKGGQYRVILADGTKVWLNAASSITYPSKFAEKERRVSIQGEAFFEVSHNAKKPFIVSTETQEIKVLGTTFNINAYKNEGMTVTTLVSGRVQLISQNISKAAYLNPGEQSVFNENAFQITPVDASIYTAWKDGEFNFNATRITEALRQIERWYNLEIDYSGIPEGILIHASIQRDRPLSHVLSALEKVTNLKFDIEGRRVKLMK